MGSRAITRVKWKRRAIESAALLMMRATVTGATMLPKLGAAAVVASVFGLALLACSTLLNDLAFQGDVPIDATPDVTVDADAGPPSCARLDPFGPPRDFGELRPGEEIQWGRLTGDELTVVYGEGITLRIADRPDRTSPFGPGQVIASTEVVRGSGFNADPMLSDDGLTLYFTSKNSTSNLADIYVAVRPTRAAVFGPPSQLAFVNSGFEDFHPYVIPPGIWFTSVRDAGTELWWAPTAGASFGAPTPQAGLGSSFYAGNPTLTLDRLTLYFASTHPEGQGGLDIWSARQTASFEGFTDIRPVTELATSFDELPLFVSRDGCRLYFQTNRSGRSRIFVAEKRPPDRLE
jgi:hypothetical protein